MKRVGVIVPCFNQGRFAAECVASLQAQTYGDLRVVVVDDASTDGSGALLDALASPLVQVVHLQRNLGRALVRNEAVRLLGDDVDYIMNVDCDDYLAPDFIAKAVEALERDPKGGLAYGTLHFFGELRERETTWPREPYVHAERYLENRIPGGVLFRAAALRETDGWRADYGRTGNEDVDIWLQVVERGWTPVWVRDAIYHYRHHGGSFLSGAGELNQARAALVILKYHREGIEETIGVSAFLERYVMPYLRGAIRRGRWKEARLLIRPATLRLLGRYYLRRLTRSA
ncbi:MAG TPA: glycosyltransferase family 2 protein [Thermoanaerobaculia bacterium]